MRSPPGRLGSPESVQPCSCTKWWWRRHSVARFANLGSYTTAYLQANASTIATIHIFGGTSAITTTTSNAAVVAAGS
jgi:hypothetical protein